MILHSFWRSSCSWRVRIALHHKGVDFEYAGIHLVRDGGEQHRPDFLARNPMAQVPVLELDSGRGIGQSLAIIEYLDEVFPEPPLLPRPPWPRARARMLAEIVNSGIQPLQNLRVTQRLAEAGLDADGWARGVIEEGLRALQAAARETAEEFLVGDRVSVADLCLVPQLYNARRLGCSLDGLDLLLAVEARCMRLPPFIRSHPDHQPDAA